MKQLFKRFGGDRLVKKINKNLTRSQYPPMKEETKALLKQYYESHNSELAELIACDLSVWG